MSWFKTVVRVIRDVEHENKSGKEKRAVAVKLINKAVDVPLLPEWVEGKVFGLLVDFTIYLYNQHFGHNWINKS